MIDIKDYWEKRYSTGGNSGNGSYGALLNFKAHVLNDFIQKNNIKSIQDFGCGDGSLLSALDLSFVQTYYGYDVSETIINRLKRIYHNDTQKMFSNEYLGINTDLVLSIDVIFHLVNDEDYYKYITAICESTSRYLIIYSSNCEYKAKFGGHIRHRNFDKDLINMSLVDTVKNKFPFVIYGDEGSFCDFYIFEKK